MGILSRFFRNSNRPEIIPMSNSDIEREIKDYYYKHYSDQPLTMSLVKLICKELQAKKKD